LKALQVGSDEPSISLAAGLVGGGGIVAFPTDTVYGLGCDPLSQTAVERLVEVKGREGKPIPVLCASREDSERLVRLVPRALELAREYWPGALTIVAPLKESVPWQLDQGRGWLGVRVPADVTAMALARACGGLITGTSANLSGRPSCRTAEEVAASLGDRIDAILDGGARTGTESTVVRVEGDSVEVLRRGGVSLVQGRTGAGLDR
jgi:L-threonylcarbamoyladenylate synthase